MASGKKKQVTAKKKAAKAKAKSPVKAKAKSRAKAKAKAGKSVAKATQKPKASAKGQPKLKPAASKKTAAKPESKSKSRTPAKPKASAAAKPKGKPVAAPPAKSPGVMQATVDVVKATAQVVRAKLAALAAPKADKPSKSASAPPAKASAGVAEGSRAPAFTLNDQNGESVSSDSLAGKPYVLYFYPKDDTAGCTTEACNFRDSAPKFGSKGLRVIGVSPDSEASHARFAGKYGLPFTLLSDPDKKLCEAFGVWTEKQNYGRTYMGVQRSTFLIGADGTIKKAWRGVRVPGHIDSVLEASAAI